MLIESGEEGKQSKVRKMTANQSARKERKRRRFFKLPLAHSEKCHLLDGGDFWHTEQLKSKM